MRLGALSFEGLKMGEGRDLSKAEIAALEAAITDGRFARARHTLFITAGAGLTIGLALYRH